MLAKYFPLLLSVSVAVHALSTPHIARGVHHRRAIIARADSPNVDTPSPVANESLRKQCKPRIHTASSTSTKVASAESTTSPLAPAESTASPSLAPAESSSPPSLAPVFNAAAPSPPATEASSAATGAPSAATGAPSAATGAPSAATEAPPPATEAPPPATETSPPTPAPNGPGFMTGAQTGQGTFYTTGVGACGITNNDGDFIAAASHLLFDSFPGYGGANPNSNPLCGKTVTVHYQGKTVNVAITDRCEACGITDLDFSPTAFSHLADFSVGRLSGMTWTWD